VGKRPPRNKPGTPSTLGAACAVVFFSLARVRLELRLVPTHPDRAGGLGFLDMVHIECTPLVLAISATQSASLDWVNLAEAQGVPATRATTAREFHQQFEAAMSTKGPRPIEARTIQNLKLAIDAVHSSRG
jgi:hypothetical protein